jgi:hypothetical protein
MISPNSIGELGAQIKTDFAGVRRYPPSRFSGRAIEARQVVAV